MASCWAWIVSIMTAIFVVHGAGKAAAQQVDRDDLSQPTPGEIAMAAECRDTYKRMRELEKILAANRDEIGAMQVNVNRSSQKLDELEAKFKTLANKSQKSKAAYKAALEAKAAYEQAAKGHNALIDKHNELTKKRIKFSDEYFVVNPNYVGKCSGTIFKALSVILTCKDEKSEWCDLLK